MPISLRIPIAICCAWLVLTIMGVWDASRRAIEPPVWDSMTYFQKAANTLQTVSQGVWTNPFSVEPTVRPPGTIAVTYPLGMSQDYRGYYFRTVVIPSALLMLAVFLANASNDVSLPRNIARCSLAVVLGSMPLLFQFQLQDDFLPVETWGRVDNFLAGVAALSAALLYRGVRRCSWPLVVLAAAVAAFSLSIKPSGAVVMAVIGVSGAILLLAQVNWSLRELRARQEVYRFALFAMIAGLAVYALAFFVALTSEYMSEANRVFGAQVIAVMRETFPRWIGLYDLFSLLRHSVGIPVLIALLLGFWWSCTRLASSNFIAALISLVFGAAFWSYSGGSYEVRYVIAFFAMAFIFLSPVVVEQLGNLRRTTLLVSAALLGLPSMITTALLFQTAPSPALQKLLGINLSVTAERGVISQTENMLAEIDAESRVRLNLFAADVTSPIRVAIAVAEYRAFTNPASMQISTALPTDWRRPHGFVLERLVNADAIVFVPMRNDALRDEALNLESVPNFEVEKTVMAAWLTQLDASSGVKILSEGRVRFLRVVNRDAFAAAVAQFRSSRRWSPSFEKNNPKTWWSVQDVVSASLSREVPPEGVMFGSAVALHPELLIRGVDVERDSLSTKAIVWLEYTKPSETGEPWFLFAHLTNASGEMVANGQIPLPSDSAPDEKHVLRRVVVEFDRVNGLPSQLALGFFAGSTNPLVHLTTQNSGSDWEGRRWLVPLAQ